MPTSHRQKSKAKPTPKPARPRRPAPSSRPGTKARPAAKAAPAPKASAKPTGKPAGKPAPKVVAAELEVPSPDGRKHMLSLSFLRDGDEFMARLETDAGHITELKNRSLDQLLTLVASELEDLLE
jgi:hypothetical protein